MKHRESKEPRKRRWWISPLLALIALALVGAWVWFQDQPTTVYERPEPEVITRTVEVEPEAASDVERAEQGKPLQDLVPGDRVLYDALDNRPVCIFTEWFGDISQSRIKCKGLPELTVETGFLTPVETLDDTATD